MTIRGEKSDKLATCIYRDRFKKAIISVIDKPTIISEIERNVAKRLDLKYERKINNYVEDLGKAGTIQCLTPELKKSKPGRVYSLSKIGVRIKKKICKKEKLSFVYNEIDDVNWENYGWCLTGTQKKSLITALDQKPLRQFEIRRKIKEFYRNRVNNRGISRQNLNDILKQMTSRGITIKEETWITKIKKRTRPVRKYKLSEEGLKIKEQVLA